MKTFIVTLFLLFTVASNAQDSLEVTKLGQLLYNETINDVWGYANGSKEYALIGVNTGFSIVDVSDPTLPVEKHFIAGNNTIWRDIKTWSHYAYVVHDGVGGSRNSDGILIVDLHTIDSANLSYTQYFPTVNIGGNSFTYRNAHNLYVDENGVLYLFGSNLGMGGASMFDLTADPNNPTFLGAYDGTYYHDGVARGDTLYGAAINIGKFEVVNVANKTSPIVWASKSTPNNFCHNIWFSPDNKTVFTTDEKKGAYITAYDVSDLSSVKELDRIRTSIYDPNEVIPHNTHVLGNFLVTSYYTSGLQIVDASQPDILIETAYYDTSPIQGDGFDGAWGAYPFLPSGNILVSDRQEGLFVLSSTYPKACFFSLFVKDSVTKNAIPTADVTLVRANIGGQTDLMGNFKGGRRDTGDFLVVVEKPGYHTDTLQVKLRKGVHQKRSIALRPIGFSINESGAITEHIHIYPNPGNGKFKIDLAGIEDPEAEIEIWDMTGKRTFHTSILMNENVMSIKPNLKQGVYIVRVTNGSVTYATQRLVVTP
jgi:choice-of-anchor B domain-containing protein